MNNKTLTAVWREGGEVMNVPKKRPGWRIGLWNKSRQIALILLEFLWKWVIRFFYKPDFIFLVYGQERHKRACWSKKRERKIGLLGLIGFIRWGDRRGLAIASTVSMEEFRDNPARAVEVTNEAEKRFPNAQVFALAGQLPGWIFRTSGQAVSKPFVGGNRGACFAVGKAISEIVSSRFSGEENLCVAVVGGAGHTGSEMVNVLAANDCLRVIAFDPRLQEETAGNIQRTSNPKFLGEASIVVALTAKGDDLKDLVPYIKSGAVVADDTHPMIGKKVRDSLSARGATLFKVTVADGRLKMWPRLPDFKPSDIPGCLLEALVVSVLKHEILATQEMFNWGADGLGFVPRLDKHPKY